MEEAGIRAILGARYVRGTLLYWLVTALGLLVIYGLNTWLVQAMVHGGYGLDSSLWLLVVLNLGPIVGAPVLGLVSDRIGARLTTAAMYLMGALALITLSRPLPLPALVIVVWIAGLCTMGTVVLVNAHTASFYSASLRVTGLGWAIAVGRLGAMLGPVYGAFVLTAGWDWQATFYAFAAPAVLAMVAILFLPDQAPERLAINE